MCLIDATRFPQRNKELQEVGYFDWTELGVSSMKYVVRMKR
jgi:hypothetical protein